jgi:uncharacterized lipoprotein YmbA
VKPIPALLLLGLLCGAGCLSKEPAVERHYFRPALGELTLEPVAGTRPLRLARVTQPAELGANLLWRVSETELVPDETNLWARRPEELLDERLRELLFGAGGFRSSMRAGDPALGVHLSRCEGDLHGKRVASVDLVLSLQDADGVERRGRIHVEEQLSSATATALAEGTGRALAKASERVLAWLREQL